MTKSVTEEYLQELERLAGAATPSPWRAGSFDKDRVFCEHGASIGPERVLLRMNENFAAFEADAAFIAAAREAVPALVAEVRALREVADIANDCAQGLEMGVSQSVIAQHLRKVLAKLDTEKPE